MNETMYTLSQMYDVSIAAHNNGAMYGVIGGIFMGLLIGFIIRQVIVDRNCSGCRDHCREIYLCGERSGKGKRYEDLEKKMLASKLISEYRAQKHASTPDDPLSNR